MFLIVTIILSINLTNLDLFLTIVLSTIPKLYVIRILNRSVASSVTILILVLVLSIALTLVSFALLVRIIITFSIGE